MIALSLISKVKRSLVIISKWEYTPLCFLTIMMLVMHFATIMQPDSQSMDEVYYVPAANSILHGESLGRTEHPPLGQSIIASGILVFGDNPLGWRFFSVIFGSILLILFYLICRELKLSRYCAFLATTLLAIDNLSFVMAGTAMLDVFCLTFMFAAALLYLKKKYIWTGVFIGLAMASKLTGVFTLLFILAHWMLTNRKSVKEMIKATVTSGFTFLASLTLLDFVIMHRLINPIERIGHMLTYSRELTFALYKSNAPVQLNIVPSRPWQWLYRLDGMAFLTMDMTKIKLLGSQMVISPETTKQVMYCLYEMIINPAIWALIVPCILFVIYLSTKQNKPALFALCWFSATYIIWIPINLITNRLTYDYYFYPAVVAVCIGIALLFSRINEFHVNNHVLRSVQRMITPLYLGISILFFVFLYLGNVWFRAVWAIILFLIILYYLDRFQSPKITRIIVSK